MPNEYGGSFINDEPLDSSEEQIPVCEYGKKCFRKNPLHFKEFAHPWLDNDKSKPNQKRLRKKNVYDDYDDEDS